MILFDDDERYMDNANTAPGVFSAGVNKKNGLDIATFKKAIAFFIFDKMKSVRT